MNSFNNPFLGGQFPFANSFNSLGGFNGFGGQPVPFGFQNLSAPFAGFNTSVFNGISGLNPINGFGGNVFGGIPFNGFNGFNGLNGINGFNGFPYGFNNLNVGGFNTGFVPFPQNVFGGVQDQVFAGQAQTINPWMVNSLGYGPIAGSTFGVPFGGFNLPIVFGSAGQANGVSDAKAESVNGEANGRFAYAAPFGGFSPYVVFPQQMAQGVQVPQAA